MLYWTRNVKTNGKRDRNSKTEPTWTVVAISNEPWFATTVEGPFGVGTGGIFATIVRVVEAFVCVWVIILVNVKFILTEQTGRQYSDHSVSKTGILGKGKCFNQRWDVRFE